MKIIHTMLVALFLVSCTERELQVKELKKSGEFSTGQVMIGNEGSNVYLVSNRQKECIIVDPAVKTRDIAYTLKKNGYTLKAVFLTHNHWDHSKEICQLSNMLDIPLITNSAQIAMGSSNISTPITSKKQIKVMHGQTINFSNITISILHSPGHSKGGMCFYHAESNSLFSGDTIFRESIGRTDVYGSEEDKIIPSIIRVFRAVSSDADIYPGHGESTTVQHEIIYNPFFPRNMGQLVAIKSEQERGRQWIKQ